MAIISIAGNQAPLTIQPRRDWDRSGKRFGSTEKARRELGFVAEVALHDGLVRTVEWVRAHRDVIERCIAKHGESMRLCQV